VDLLDDLGEEAGNEKAARREGVLAAQGGNAAALLLAGVRASVGDGASARRSEERAFDFAPFLRLGRQDDGREAFFRG